MIEYESEIHIQIKTEVKQTAIDDTKCDSHHY